MLAFTEAFKAGDAFDVHAWAGDFGSEEACLHCGGWRVVDGGCGGARATTLAVVVGGGAGAGVGSNAGAAAGGAGWMAKLMGWW